MVEVFEATFEAKKIIDSTLVLKWFKMALDEFSAEIEPLNFDYGNNYFIYLDAEGNEIELPHLYTQVLGFTIKRLYCERQYDKIIKRTNIIGKDITINNTDADKKNAKAELDYVDYSIGDFYAKLKPSAYL